jgi:hypothetical protein
MFLGLVIGFNNIIQLFHLYNYITKIIHMYPYLSFLKLSYPILVLVSGTGIVTALHLDNIHLKETRG